MLLGCSGVGLQGGVPHLHDVAVAGDVKVTVGQVPMHDVPPAGPETELDRGGVAHDLVVDLNQSGQLGQIIRALTIMAFGKADADSLEPLTFADEFDDDAGPERRHPYPATRPDPEIIVLTATR
jgi:hypothetical protein